MQRLLLTRHGQTEWNVAGCIQGWGDSPLTGVGLRQAGVAHDGLLVELGEHLSDEHVFTRYTVRSGSACETRMTTERITTTDVAEAVEALRAADEDEAFWTSQFERLVRQFPDQFVAVRDGDVVAAAGQLEDLLTTLSARRLDPQQMRIRFIPSDPSRYLL